MLNIITIVKDPGKQMDQPEQELQVKLRTKKQKWRFTFEGKTMFKWVFKIMPKQINKMHFYFFK